MSAAKILELVAYRLNRVSTDLSAHIVDWLNLWEDDIQQRFPTAPFYEASAYLTTSAATDTYALTGVEKPFDFRIPAYDVKLGYLSQDQFDIAYPQATATGCPAVYTLWNSQPHFYPIPNSSIDIYYRYFKKGTGFFTASALSAMESIIDSTYQSTAIEFCVQMGALEREQFDLAQLAKANYEQMVERMKEDLQRKNDEVKIMRTSRVLHGASDGTTDKGHDIFWG